MDSEKRIIVSDDSWKEQVRKEKEALKAPQAPAATQAPPGEAEATEEAPKGVPAGKQKLSPLCAMLILPLYQRVAAALGLMPDPQTGRRVVRMDEAMQYAVLIQVLYEKTKGNRTPEEEAFFREVLADVSVGLNQMAAQVREMEDRELARAAQASGIKAPIPGVRP
jgi:hypothetical protein